jgi:starch-binding outer membrane protein, SusD/RagB family
MRTRHVALLLGALAVGGCSLPNDPNLNGPSVTDYTTITNLAQVQTLTTGVLRGDRIVAEQQIYFGEIVGRDAFILTASEFRYETELLGPSIDPAGFIGARMWPYGTVRLASIGYGGVSAAPSNVLNAADKASTLGFLQTQKALEYLRMEEMRDSAGVAIVTDTNPLGPLAPLSCKHDVLNYIAALLDSGATNLAAGGATFPFSLPAGFAGFDAPATYRTFNRGLAAKVQVYLAFRNYASAGTIDAAALAAAQAALNASFMVQDSTQLDLGPQHTYSTSTGDATNSLFDTDTSGTTYRVNPRVRAEADVGDNRVARKTAVSSTVTVSGETSNLVFTLYLSPTTPTKILTNKELLLLQAEVNWGLGNYATALLEADFIRQHDGKLTTDTTTAAAAGVLNRILYEKRYSLLWQSADRFLDARQFGKLNGSNPPAGVGLERTYAPLYNWPLPANEQNARNGVLTKQCTSGT